MEPGVEPGVDLLEPGLYPLEPGEKRRLLTLGLDNLDPGVDHRLLAALDPLEPGLRELAEDEDREGVLTELALDREEGVLDLSLIHI